MIKKASFSFIVPALLTLIMWIVKTMELQYGYDFAEYGVLPRTLSGLRGILFSPFIHGDLEHIWSNTFPMLILGTMIIYFFDDIWQKVYLQLFFFSGIGLWLIGRESYHIGASGFIYGMIGFIFFSGIFRKDYRLLALTFVVVFLYGGFMWGILPILIKVSWEAHLAGLITGMVVAFIYREHQPPKLLYQWEREEIDELMSEHVVHTHEYWKNADTSTKKETPNEVKVNYIFKEAPTSPKGE